MLDMSFKYLIIISTVVATSKTQSPDPSSPAVLYLPLGGGGVNECEPAAGAKLQQLVPLMFAGMTFTIFDAVANINNRINSNNNNNNNDNINFQQSVNTVVSGNINVANQINVMNVMGRKKREDNHDEEYQEIKKKAAAIARKGFEALLTLEHGLKSDIGLYHLQKSLLY